ncbi:GNAT family N-acetyltransferase [Cumulibacter soli]|uniref:GNAT family N-acetyltransferase n=1 Tax=Cumulibacter soli TaxID=2546344 RepID=UPI001067B517|nr:GNAT family N-acetyltransferase [Cumulibacter soli]
MPHHVSITGTSIQTTRLTVRPWRESDARGAFEIYGSTQVSRWLTPAMEHIHDIASMRAIIARWNTTPPNAPGRAVGRWAIEERTTGQIIGSGQILPLPPVGEDLEIGYQLAPDAWGMGFAAEAGHALAHYAFANGEDELFAVVRPRNFRAEHAARRIGMDWVGETDKYYGLRLQVFRLRKSDIDIPTPDTPHT